MNCTEPCATVRQLAVRTLRGTVAVCVPAALAAAAPGILVTPGEPAPDLRLPVPVPPDPARLMQLAAVHGIQILPSPEP